MISIQFSKNQKKQYFIKDLYKFEIFKDFEDFFEGEETSLKLIEMEHFDYLLKYENQSQLQVQDLNKYLAAKFLIFDLFLKDCENFIKMKLYLNPSFKFNLKIKNEEKNQITQKIFFMN